MDQWFWAEIEVSICTFCKQKVPKISGGNNCGNLKLIALLRCLAASIPPGPPCCTELKKITFVLLSETEILHFLLGL